MERGAARLLNRRAVLTLAAGVPLAVAFTAYTMFILAYVPPSPLTYVIAIAPPALATASYAVTLRTVFRRRRLLRMLRRLELWMTGEGVAYRCAAGHFGVPWSSVRDICIDTPKGRAGRHIDLLSVYAENWPGPLGGYGTRRRPAAVVMPITSSPVTRDWIVAAIRARRDGGVPVT